MDEKERQGGQRQTNKNNEQRRFLAVPTLQQFFSLIDSIQYYHIHHTRASSNSRESTYIS
jgi:predicted ATPase